MTDAGTPQRLSQTTLAAGRFLRLERLEYRDGQGHRRCWESAARQGKTAAVLVIPVLRPSGRLVLIRQYRPPLDAYVIEFPAGLIDAGETPVAAAQRELAEETGYQGTVRWLGPPTCSSPGLTSESVILALLDIDEDLPQNRAPQARLDEGEAIEVCVVAAADLGTFLRAQQEAGARLDSRTVAYALGLGLTC
jgi:ADP-ribose pyrophosphatase